MQKEEIIKYLQKEIETFDLKQYLKENNKSKDNGAFGIITPNQMILSRTLNEGKEDHNPTYDKVMKILYSIPLSNSKEYNSKEQYLIKHQNIYLRLFNEQVIPLFGNMKSIWIHLPDSVTEEQLTFLKQLEQEYGNFIKQISLKQCEIDQDPLVGFNKLNGETILGDSFKLVIEYIEKNLLNNHNDIVEEDIIIGKTLKENNYEKTGRQI